MHLSTSDILSLRGAKNDVNEHVPYGYFVERECSADGRIVDVATVLLTNRECPFRCLMCDLWKNTTDESVSVGAIPKQVDYALARLPSAESIKLYNSGNFFDPRAIPPADYAAIASRVNVFETVVIENHPRFCDERCVEFAGEISGQLEVAIGLETIHPEILPRLNKQMTTADYRAAVEFLVGNGLRVRTFILLRPPWLSEAAGVEWALRSAEFAFDCGVECCAIVPTRGGNGAMEQLAEAEIYSPPTIDSLEQVLQHSLAWQRGRVLVDLWDAQQFCACAACGPARVERLHQMNLQQRLLPSVSCSQCNNGVHHAD